MLYGPRGEVDFQLPVDGEVLEFEGETPTLVLLLGSVSVVTRHDTMGFAKRIEQERMRHELP